MTPILSEADRLFRIIEKGRRGEREAIIPMLESLPDDGTLQRLRTLILEKLRGEYHPERQYTDEDRGEAANTRSWLLASLTRTARQDDEAKKIAREHLEPAIEPSEWTRYWTLEGLIRSNADDIVDVARHVLEHEPEDLGRRLAQAVLAARGNSDALKEIVANAGDWATMRALRVVPLPGAVTKLCELVERTAYADDTYEAIVALGHVPRASSRAEKAAHSLEVFIAKVRGFPRFDEMRTRALVSLGNLGALTSAPLMLDEIVDDHPAIVREAARGLASVLGERIAAARVVEQAIKAGRDQIGKYAIALRWMPAAPVLDEIEAAMVSGPSEAQMAARTLLSEIGGAAALQKLMARARSTDQYTQLLQAAEEKVRSMFETSLKEARRGFSIATAMDVFVFVLGFGLILTSAILLLRSGGTLDSWAGIGVTGGSGVLGILYSVLVAKPRQQVRETVDHLMYLKIVFLGYLRQLHQADQAYTRRMLEDEVLALDEVAKFGDMVGATMAKAADQLLPKR